MRCRCAEDDDADLVLWAVKRGRLGAEEPVVAVGDIVLLL